MKKLLSILLVILILSPSVPAFAADSFITLEPYPYSTHILGENLVIYGDTDFGNITLGFYYPEDQGYFGYAKYIMTISAQELRSGYVIRTEEYSRLWPEGVWTVKVQNGDVSDTLKINMSKEAEYNRYVKLATYEDDALTSLTTYPCRGTRMHDNVLSFTLSDNTTVKIFSWDNLTPAESGESRIYIAFFDPEGYMTDIKTYQGTLSQFGNHFTLNISPTKKVKLFYWTDNLIPLE